MGAGSLCVGVTGKCPGKKQALYVKHSAMTHRVLVTTSFVQ